MKKEFLTRDWTHGQTNALVKILGEENALRIIKGEKFELDFKMDTASMGAKYILTRDVTQEQCSWLQKSFQKDEIVYAYLGYDYGCITPQGKPFTFDGIHFFELPIDSVSIPLSNS